MVLIFAGLTFSRRRRAVPLLRPGRLPGHDPSQRRVSCPSLPKAAGLLALVRAGAGGHCQCMESYAWKIALVLRPLRP